MLRAGIVTYNIARTWDLDTLIANLTEVGILGVELRSTHAHGVEVDLEPRRRESVRRQFDDSPVDLVSLGTACEYHSPDPAVLRRNIELTKKFIELAHDVGAEGIKVRPNGMPRDDGGPLTPEKTLEQIGRAFRECAEYGEGYGVKVSMEVHGRGTNRLVNMRTILDHAGHDNACITWNSNATDLEDGGLEENFRLVRDRIGLVHLRDLYTDYPHRALFRLLRDAGYDGFCCAEIPASKDPVRVLRYFKALFEALST